jgi:dipeptide/tripeptide permease
VSEPEYDLDNLRLIHDEIAARTGRLADSGARLDAKATTLLGFVLAAATFLAAHTGPFWWKFATFAAMAVAGALAMAAMTPRKHHDAPEPEQFWQFTRKRKEPATLALLIAAKIKVFNTNHKIHEGKAALWRWSLVALTLAVLLTVTTLAIGSTQHGGSAELRHPVPVRHHR